MTAPWAQDVLRYWFEELAPEDWFSGRRELDQEIGRRFGPLCRKLRNAPPAAATLDGDGLLAAVIVFDQFSRNIHRGNAEAFATDGMALRLAEHAIDCGMDRTMPPERRLFLYMPFMHCEDPAIQLRSVALFTALGLPEHLHYALGHKDIVTRFGRFPARNTALGRISTLEETTFLENSAEN